MQKLDSSLQGVTTSSIRSQDTLSSYVSIGWKKTIFESLATCKSLHSAHISVEYRHSTVEDHFRLEMIEYDVGRDVCLPTPGSLIFLKNPN